MDLIVCNAKIWQGEGRFVRALAVEGGRIIAVGNNEEVLRLRRPTTRVLDAGGRLVVPGFNDAHAHLVEGGFQLLGVDLRDAADEEEFCRRLRLKAAQLPKGSWITGGYWDHERWPGKRLPNKELIDRAVPDHPVFVVRLDWHIGCANSLALRLAGIDRHTEAPAGGAIDRDPLSGEPTGILRETAHRLIERVQPRPDKAQRLLALQAALKHAAERGVTSVQGPCKPDEIELFKELIAEERLTLRISAWQIIAEESDIPSFLESEPVDHPYLRTGVAKLFCDGSFGAATALLWQAYENQPNQYGIAVHDLDHFMALVDRLHRAGRPLAIHAIGDRAVTWAFNAIGDAQTRHGRKGLRHRIEHAQMVREEDLHRFKQLEVIASVQPSHAIDDMRWIEDRVGARTRTTYRFASLLQAGAIVAVGTDWTVEPIDPMLTLYAAVSREFPQGGPPGGWQPQEKISLDQALSAYTWGSAFAEYLDKEKGRLLPGQYADFVILSQDLFSLPPRQWLATKTDVTVVDGRVVFER